MADEDKDGPFPWNNPLAPGRGSPLAPGRAPSPPPPNPEGEQRPGGHAHSYLSRFSFTDIVVLVVNECLGVPLCIAGGENFARTDWVGSAIGWGVGIPLCVSGVTFPFWRGTVKAAVATWAEKWWGLLLPGAILLAFSYAAGPEMYRRATKPIAVTGAIGAMPIGTASIDEAVKQATKQIEAARDEAIKSAARAAKERDDALRDLADMTRGRDSALTDAKSVSSPSSPPTQSPVVSGPVDWALDGQLIVASYGGPSSLYVLNALIFQGTSKTSFHFKEAYLISGLTGHRADLVANVHKLGAYYPVTAVDVPAGAPVQLDYDFKPEMSVRDFFDQWGKFRFVIVYDDGSSFEHEFSEQEVRAQAQRQMPNAFGPQVTPKEQK